MLCHPDVDGKLRHYPLPYHGNKTLIKVGILKDIIRIFELPGDIFDSN